MLQLGANIEMTFVLRIAQCNQRKSLCIESEYLEVECVFGFSDKSRAGHLPYPHSCQKITNNTSLKKPRPEQGTGEAISGLKFT